MVHSTATPARLEPWQGTVMRRLSFAVLVACACGGPSSEPRAGTPAAAPPAKAASPSTASPGDPAPTASPAGRPAAQPPAAQPPAVQPPAAQPPATPPSPAVDPAVAPPPAPPVAPLPEGAAATLATGDPRLGCMAWSSRLHAAACITGERTWSGTTLAFVVVGAESPEGAEHESIDLDQTVEESIAARANEILARDGYAPLTAARVDVAAGKPTEVAGITVSFTSTETDPGGENQAPTMRNVVEVRCRGAARRVFEDEAEGHDAKVATRTLDGHVLVEVSTSIALEGEYGEAFEAFVVDPATCR